MKTSITITINPQNSAFNKQLQSLQKQLGINIVPSKDQKVNTANITLVGASQK